MIWCAILRVHLIYRVLLRRLFYPLDPGRKGIQTLLQFLQGEPVLLHSSGCFLVLFVVCFLPLTDLSFRQSLDFGLGLWTEL